MSTFQWFSEKHPIPWTSGHLHQLIDLGMQEDLQGGDVTSFAIVSKENKTSAKMVAKEDLLVCGLPLVYEVFKKIDPEIELKLHCSEGDWLTKGTTLLSIQGRVHSILMAERLALNFLQHLSGIASLARNFSKAVEGTHTKVVDTRKTLPGWRPFQKYAVLVGGCYNHRYNLSSGVMLKENHIRSAGGIAHAVQKVRATCPHTLRIEVEVTNLQEYHEALQEKVDIIMLDNMSLNEMKQAVEAKTPQVLLEASGGVTLDTIKDIAQTGVDIVSVGALTHSVKASDISLLVDPF